MGMMIAGMIEDEMAAQETPLEEETEPKDTMRPPKKKEKKTRSASKPGKAKSLHARTSKRASKGNGKQASKNTGTVRESPAGAFHVMSVHIPIPMLKKLDAKIAKLKKDGKPHASRSGFAIYALTAKL